MSNDSTSNTPCGLDVTELAPAMRARRSRVVATGGEARGSVASQAVLARRFACECVLDALREAGALTDRQWAAGMRFRADWRAAVDRQRLVADYQQRVGMHVDLSTAAIAAGEAAETRITDALRHAGIQRGAVLASVAGEDQAVGSVHRLGLLRQGLDVVADLWGIDVRTRAHAGPVVAEVDDETDLDAWRSGRWRA